jgi:hypothetical protein
MSPRFLLLLCLIILAFPRMSQAETSINCQKPAINGMAFTMTCDFAHQSRPLTLVMGGSLEPANPEQAHPEKVDVLYSDALIQILPIDLDEGDSVRLNQMDKTVMAGTDLNFDGFDDLSIATSGPPYASANYWLYAPAKGLFTRRADLDSELFGVDVDTDAQNKTVIATGRPNGFELDKFIYHWAGKKLILRKSSATGALQIADLLSDVKNVQKFILTSGAICATDTTNYDDNNRVTKEVIETDGTDCPDDKQYRIWARSDHHIPDGAVTHDGMTDLYQGGFLITRTLIYDPPRPADSTGITD